MSLVLVTGGTGFIAGHLILKLLSAGHQVRTTVRSLDREVQVRAILNQYPEYLPGQLSFFAADLKTDNGWDLAPQGCDTVFHLASPFPAFVPRDENELIIPAREGTLRILRASRRAGVRRVIMTSSFAAIGYGHEPQSAPLDETFWTDPMAVSAYPKSKTLAERAAWDFVAKEGPDLALTVINPVAVFGPILGPDFSSSIGLIKKMLQGGIPACPNIYFSAVDVRDVADLHILAMKSPAARGERFMAVAGSSLSMIEVAQLLRKAMGTMATKVPTRVLPDWAVRLIAPFNPTLRAILPELGVRKDCSHEKARKVLNWNPRTREEAIIATAKSLQKFGLL